MPDVELRRTRYSPGQTMLPHVDGCRRISVVLAGTLVEGHHRREDSCGPGSVCIKSAELVHHDRYGPEGTEMLAVLLPDPLLAALDLESRWLDWAWRHEGAPRRAALRLAVAALRGDGVALAGALGELAVPLRESGTIVGAPPARARIERIRERLHDEPEAVLRVTELAREAGLHPVTLGHHFRRAFGCSIRDYRQRLRSEEAAIALMERRRPLTAIALDHGFFDLSHLTRVFRREFALPPGRFRRALGGRDDPLQSCKTAWSVAI